MLTRKGQAGWFFAGPGEYQTDRFGLGTATATWRRFDVGIDVNPGSPIAVRQAHPTWSFLDCDKITIRRGEAGWECEGQFFGVESNPEPIYDLDYSTSEEPIETHRDFRTAIGGTPTAKLNGAAFDSDGEFTGFKGPFANDFEMDTWRGVRSYLSPGAIWRKNYVTKTRPTDMGELGKVDIPEGNEPSVPTGMNWLYVGLTWEQRGLTYQVKKEWRLSGRRGWNRTIYT